MLLDLGLVPVTVTQLRSLRQRIEITDGTYPDLKRKHVSKFREKNNYIITGVIQVSPQTKEVLLDIISTLAFNGG